MRRIRELPQVQIPGPLPALFAARLCRFMSPVVLSMSSTHSIGASGRTTLDNSRFRFVRQMSALSRKPDIRHWMQSRGSNVRSLGISGRCGVAPGMSVDSHKRTLVACHQQRQCGTSRSPWRELGLGQNSGVRSIVAPINLLSR